MAPPGKPRKAPRPTKSNQKVGADDDDSIANPRQMQKMIKSKQTANPTKNTQAPDPAGAIGQISFQGQTVSGAEDIIKLCDQAANEEQRQEILTASLQSWKGFEDGGESFTLAVNAYIKTCLQSTQDSLFERFAEFKDSATRYEQTRDRLSAAKKRITAHWKDSERGADLLRILFDDTQAFRAAKTTGRIAQLAESYAPVNFVGALNLQMLKGLEDKRENPSKTIRGDKSLVVQDITKAADEKRKKDIQAPVACLDGELLRKHGCGTNEYGFVQAGGFKDQKVATFLITLPAPLQKVTSRSFNWPLEWTNCIPPWLQILW